MTAATLPPAADPGDVPSPTTERYQAEGLAAATAALQLNGPIKPAPYFEAPAPLPTRRRRTRISRAHLAVVLSEPYRLWVMNEGPRPTATEENPMSQTPQETIRSATECLTMLDGLQSRANQTPAEAQVYVRERTRQEQRLADARRAA